MGEGRFADRVLVGCLMEGHTCKNFGINGRIILK
jgi:hypothetical protein